MPDDTHLRLGLFACAVVATMLATTFALVRLERRDRLRARIKGVMTPYQRAVAAPGQADTGVALAQVSQGIGRRLARLFGFSLASQDHYIVKWWLALGAALLLAFVMERLLALMVGDVTLLTVPAMWLFFSRSFFGWCDARRQEQLFVQLPDALAMIVRAVRVGIPVSDGIRAVGFELPYPTGPEFARIADEIRIGTPLEQALQSLAEHTGMPEYRFFSTTLALQSQTGGGLSETLENLSETIRKRVAVRKRGSALAAEAKTSALVLALLPLLAAGGLLLISPSYILVLFTDPLGKQILGAAVASLLSGVGVMRFIIRRSLG
jgi:tight adherence protein B